jgi:outer membrane protein TolC
VILLLTVNAQTPEKLTLDFCHKRAVEVYPLVKQKILNQEAAGLRKKNADKNYLPQFDINGRATYQSEVTEVPISFPGVSIPTPDKDMYDLHLALNQLIWDGGITREQKKIEDADLLINQQQVEVELYKVKERVNGLFYKILLYQKSREALLTNRETVAGKLKDIESGIRNGMVLQSTADVLQAQILVIDQGLVEIDTDQGATLAMLGKLLDMPIPVSTVFVMPDPAIDTQNYDNTRPEYLLLNLQKSKLDISKNLISASYLPKFSGFGKLGYGKPGLNMLSTEFDSYYYVGVGLTWDILNWNKQNNQKKLLDVQQSIVETQKETFDKNTKIQVSDDLAQIEKYAQLISKDQEIIDLRKKITTTANSQLDNGIITSTQYLDELNRETTSMLDLELHRIRLSLAKINYLKTIGKL